MQKNRNGGLIRIIYRVKAIHHTIYNTDSPPFLYFCTEESLGLFKCIVSDLFFYNNQKSATSVFVIPTSVLVISCKSVSSIQKP